MSEVLFLLLTKKVVLHRMQDVLSSPHRSRGHYT
jgi:hypothetical protein